MFQMTNCKLVPLSVIHLQFLTGPLDKKDDLPAGQAGKKEDQKTKPEVGSVIYPFTAFGSKEKVKSEEILIKNATVWTNEKDGILQNILILRL